MFFRSPFGPGSFEEDYSDDTQYAQTLAERRPGDPLGEPPIVGLFKAIGGALRLPGTQSRQSDESVSEHDPYGFRRNPRNARWEVGWEAEHSKQEARQELLWAQHEGDRRDGTRSGSSSR